MITKDIDVIALRDIAITTLSDVLPGEVFIMKDLFKGFEWARLPQGTRIKLGSLFLQYAKSDEGELVVEVLEGKDGKTLQNQQKYRKKPNQCNCEEMLR